VDILESALEERKPGIEEKWGVSSSRGVRRRYRKRMRKNR
jgi:hypothetical protein